MSDLLAVGVVVVGVMYWRGLSRVRAVAGPGRLVHATHAASFVAGLVAVMVAVVGPVDTRADGSLTAHMVQHLLLLVVAPPLLVLGRPLPTLLWALRDTHRSALDPFWRWAVGSGRGAGWTRWAGIGLLIQSGGMVLWHEPVAFDAAERSPWLHGLEHVTFLATALIFWWGIVGAGRRARFGSAVLAVFLASLPCTALGAALALADHAWYARYTALSPATALSDQQMAGVVMWSLGGMAYVIAGVALFYAWVAGMEHNAPARTMGSAG